MIVGATQFYQIQEALWDKKPFIIQPSQQFKTQHLYTGGKNRPWTPLDQKVLCEIKKPSTVTFISSFITNTNFCLIITNVNKQTAHDMIVNKEPDLNQVPLRRNWGFNADRWRPLLVTHLWPASLLWTPSQCWSSVHLQKRGWRLLLDTNRKHTEVSDIQVVSRQLVPDCPGVKMNVRVLFVHTDSALNVLLKPWWFYTWANKSLNSMEKDNLDSLFEAMGGKGFKFFFFSKIVCRLINREISII